MFVSGSDENVKLRRLPSIIPLAMANYWTIKAYSQNKMKI